LIAWLKKGNAAVVTGGANGIGLAAAQRFLAEGMNVLIADVDQNALESAKDVLGSHSGELMTQFCDVTDAIQVEELKQIAYKSFGRVDCLMNNAGASVTSALPWEDLNGWKKQVDINLWGIIHGCHAFIPSMLKSDESVAVINTGSKQGITNPPGGYAYNMSKAGLMNYTQSVAHGLRQIEDCPVSVHLLVPGFTYTNMISKFIPKKPPAAWAATEVIDFMIESLAKDDFYIICPDNETPRDLDNKRMQWAMDDLINNRPALSRWHPDFAAAYEAFLAE
jgi:NAD(P)-dependent dehydrogenase (short-subunit alcohol dehydrogenase family)